MISSAEFMTSVNGRQLVLPFTDYGGLDSHPEHQGCVR